LAALPVRAVPARQVVLVRLPVLADPVVRVAQPVQAQRLVRAEQPVQAQRVVRRAAASLQERLLWVVPGDQRSRPSFSAAMARTTA
jgi:hypothetical protein